MKRAPGPESAIVQRVVLRMGEIRRYDSNYRPLQEFNQTN